MATPTIELVLPQSAVNSVAIGFYRMGFNPLAAAVFVASRPFVFDGNLSTGRYTVKSLATGKITEDYLGATIETRIVDGDFFFFMDNGDVLNISAAQRHLAAAVLDRLSTLVNVGGNPN